MEYSLSTLATFLLRIFEVFAEFSIIFNVFNKKIKTFHFFFIVIIYTTIVQFIKPIVPYSIYWIIPPTLMYTFSLIFLKSKWQKALIICLITLTITTILDSIISVILVTIFNLSSFESIIGNKKMYYLALFLLSFILFLISLSIKHFKLLKVASSEEIQKSAGILTNTIATFLFIVPNCFIILLYFDKKTLPIWIIFLNTFSIIFMMALSIFNTNRSVKQAITEERRIYQENYITTLENLVDSLRTFKHDYSNTLATINGYIQLENWNGLKKFFPQIIDESKAISTLDKLNPNLIKNPTIFGLITAKYQVCLKRNVKMNFEILGTLEELSLNEFELSRILGIFLDNAIEAASGSKDKKINFLISELKTKTTIELSNSYSYQNLKIADMFKKGISSKGKNRGLGLFKVKQILEKHPDIHFETISNNNLFLQKLVIPKC